jgi:hypothetical protein
MSAVLRLTILTTLAGGAWALADDAKNQPATPPPQYTKAGEIEGIIVKATPSDSGGTVTLRVSKLTYDSGNRQVNYGRYGRRPTPRVKEEEVDFTLTPDAHVRWHKLPKVYGDDGKPRARTPEELRELQGGPAGLPGYPAKFTDLSADQRVILHLVRPKDPAPPPAPKGNKGDAPAAKQPLVSRIVILNELTPPPNSKAPDKKK